MLLGSGDVSTTKSHYRWVNFLIQSQLNLFILKMIYSKLIFKHIFEVASNTKW